MPGMSDTHSPVGTEHAVDWLDVPAARRRFERAAPSTAGVDVLAREIERRMAERLELVRVAPDSILDAGCGLGAGSAMLRKRYPQARLIGVDSAWRVLRQAALSRSLGTRVQQLLSGGAPLRICGDICDLPLTTGSISMAWSNLALAWTPEPMRAFGELGRVLAPGGLLMFSSYGPDTLKELRAAFASADACAHVHPFIDMHDLGDMLVASGFVTPVMDMETVTLTYANFEGLSQDLRLSGQSNVARDRARGMLGRNRFARMRAAYEAARKDGRLPATIEVIYGHAWRGEPRVAKDGRAIIQLQIPARRNVKQR